METSTVPLVPGTVVGEVKQSDSSSDGDLKADLKKTELEERSSSFRVGAI